MVRTLDDLQMGIAATRAGDYQTAHACFLRLLQREPHNELAWLWLSRVMPTVEQALRCVEHLLSLNPQHQEAQETKTDLTIRLLLEESSVVAIPPPVPASTPQRRYLLGEALVEAQVITQAQLQRALHEQARLAYRNKPLRLGDVLLQLKLVRPEQLEGAIAAQIESRSPGMDQAKQSLFGGYLVQCGLITLAQLHQGLAQQAEFKRHRHPMLLGDVLVRCGYLQRDQLNRAVFGWQQQRDFTFH